MEATICLVLITVITLLLIGCLVIYIRLRRAHEINKKLEDRIVYLELELFDRVSQIKSLNEETNE